MLSSEILDLSSLLRRQSAGTVQLCVNHFLVLDVDQRAEVSNGGSDQGQAPKRHKLDEEVGHEGCEEGLDIKVRMECYICG